MWDLDCVRGKNMEITVEAIYEAGVLKLLHPLPQLREHEKVQLVIQTTAQNDRDRATEVLRQARLLAESGPGTRLVQSHHWLRSSKHFPGRVVSR